MDFILGNRTPIGRKRFLSITGTIVELLPAGVGSRRADGCILFAGVEDTEGNTVNFMVTPVTYVVDFETLSVGMQCTFWYAADAPAPLIYPPQYHAVVAARERNGRMVSVGHFDLTMVNEDRTLQLNLDGSVDIRTTNNQHFQGSPSNRNLVVIYESSTRSIPAQTTPREVIVLCDTGER
nr:hypothetical protein [uncultured Acetatifactor sp.]